MLLGMGWMAAVCGQAEPPLSAIAQREVQRREALVREADARLAEAALLLSSGKSDEAAAAYFQLYQSLPDAAMAQAARSQARAGFAVASCHWAEKLMAEARYQEAAQALDRVLAEGVDPRNERARKLRERFKDIDRYPPALTPQHIETVKKAEQLLLLAASAKEIGDYDKAAAAYEDVLRLDSHNTAARRGMEEVERLKTEYGETARDHTRAKMLGLAAREWETPVQMSAADLSAAFGAAQASTGITLGGRDELLRKLRTIVLPKVEFTGTTVEEAVEYLRVRSRDLDPKGRGVDFVVNLPAEMKSKAITLSLEQAPLEELIRYITEMSGVAYRVEDRAVVILSLTERSGQLLTRQYRVPPNFIETQAIGGPAGGAPADPFAQAPAANAAGLKIRRMGAKEFLESRGVTFKDGASAAFNPYNNILFVRNTPDNIAIVDMLVEQAMGQSPKQVVVSVKMIEVDEKQMNELSFDTALGPANIPGTDRIFAQGAGVPSGASGSPNLLSSSLRGSDNLLANTGIDGLLVGANNIAEAGAGTPAAFRLIGVFSDPAFSVSMKGYNQTKGTNILAAPSVVTKSGQKASINIIREFPYPTEFEPPEIPQQFTGAQVGGTITTFLIGPGGTQITNFAAGITGGVPPITPTTPTAFTTKNVGTVLDVEPVISEDGRSVEVSIAISDTLFEGFVDYGSDITNIGNTGGQVTIDYVNNTFSNTDRQVSYVVDNPILQPVFKVNNLSTGVTVWDGSTIVLGGTLGHKVSDINDKVPFLGDIPLIGRLWQSKARLDEKKNVVFFVHVKVIDPSGQRINQAAAPAAETAAR